MGYCEQCGCPLEDGDFCTNCGAKATQQQEEQRQWCWQCGQQMQGDVFCPSCGARQEGQTVEEPPKRKGKAALTVLLAILLFALAVGAGFLAWQLTRDGDDRYIGTRQEDEDEDEETEEEETEEEETEETDDREDPSSEPDEEPAASEETDPSESTGPTRSEETETTAPETTEPVQVTEPEEVLTQVTLNNDGQYAVNIFLSNFSEQNFREGETEPFLAADADAGEILRFVFTYKQINTSTLNGRKNNAGEVYLTLSEVNDVALRFFARSLTMEEAAAAGFRTGGQKIYHTLSTGESHSYVTVVDTMWQREDGTYLVEFTVYAVGSGYASNGIITNKNVYYMTPAKAAQSGSLTVFATGTAQVQAYIHNGRSTYQLLQYLVY